jgi:hypothetical protein
MNVENAIDHSNKSRLARICLLSIAVASGLSGIRKSEGETIPPLDLPRAFRLLQYKSGSIVTERTVHGGIRSYDALIDFLNNHQDGWAVDVNSYAPSLYFRAKDMRINCREDMVVVNFKDDGNDRWRQLSNAVVGCESAVLDVGARSMP